MSAPEGPQADEALCARVRAVLATTARNGRLISYRDLAAEAGVPEPHRIHKVTLLLEALIEEDHRAGRPLLASFAVSRARAGLPGRGFFLLLADLGRYAGPSEGPEAAAAFRRELEAAGRYWAGR